MIFTEEWLRQYVNPALGTDELADALTMAGLEVEEVRTIAPAFSGVVVGEVLSCRDHENSDHLHVCEVNAGTGETLQIVCGAPNVRAGIKVACATIGAVLPGDFRIKKSKLRGVVSMGMLCSTRELGINEDHNGIWILPDDAPVGGKARLAPPVGFRAGKQALAQLRYTGIALDDPAVAAFVIAEGAIGALARAHLRLSPFGIQQIGRNQCVILFHGSATPHN